MQKRRMDRLLVTHCAPVLAGLKTAGMFSFLAEDQSGLGMHLARWNALLNGCGIYATVICKCPARSLIYVYRKKALEDDIACRAARALLDCYGYAGGVGRHIAHLRKRIGDAESFPHEIGLFLGYPLHDVAGFIENSGRGYKLAGPWKVYDGVKEAQCTFKKYSKCKDIYLKMYDKGKSIAQLTVAA